MKIWWDLNTTFWRVRRVAKGLNKREFELLSTFSLVRTVLYCKAVKKGLFESMEWYIECYWKLKGDISHSVLRCLLSVDGLFSFYSISSKLIIVPTCTLKHFSTYIEQTNYAFVLEGFGRIWSISGQMISYLPSLPTHLTLYWYLFLRRHLFKILFTVWLKFSKQSFE